MADDQPSGRRPYGSRADVVAAGPTSRDAGPSRTVRVANVQRSGSSGRGASMPMNWIPAGSRLYGLRGETVAAVPTGRDAGSSGAVRVADDQSPGPSGYGASMPMNWIPAGRRAYGSRAETVAAGPTSRDAGSSGAVRVADDQPSGPSGHGPSKPSKPKPKPKPTKPKPSPRSGTRSPVPCAQGLDVCLLQGPEPEDAVLVSGRVERGDDGRFPWGADPSSRLGQGAAPGRLRPWRSALPAGEPARAGRGAPPVPCPAVRTAGRFGSTTAASAVRSSRASGQRMPSSSPSRRRTSSREAWKRLRAAGRGRVRCRAPSTAVSIHHVHDPPRQNIWSCSTHRDLVSTVSPSITSTSLTMQLGAISGLPPGRTVTTSAYTLDR
ncbi:hypothetical protein SAMN05216489_04938 [Streptomyces sp. 3213]|nr:hypothetical protein SAMN05216489_04938 [Streptomyces sp. 3213] [Streptomyces sp. 3213.3]